MNRKKVVETIIIIIICMIFVLGYAGCEYMSKESEKRSSTATGCYRITTEISTQI